LSRDLLSDCKILLILGPARPVCPLARFFHRGGADPPRPAWRRRLHRAWPDQSQGDFPRQSPLGRDDHAGARICWNGVDTNIVWRGPGGLRVNGGTSTGRAVRDQCRTEHDAPNVKAREGNTPACNPYQRWTANVRGSASYTVPKISAPRPHASRFRAHFPNQSFYRTTFFTCGLRVLPSPHQLGRHATIDWRISVDPWAATKDSLAPSVRGRYHPVKPPATDVDERGSAHEMDTFSTDGLPGGRSRARASGRSGSTASA
jgi:hypothetical protein